ncbi:hypothetical protein CCMA1212_001730 [Trichoderma ghanense]|uniref:Uncharacterized protein n=1 Tax=Trichoderma ghanense TaxID=65468 RepID=A0ABY2HG68_9HYPO
MVAQSSSILHNTKLAGHPVLGSSASDTRASSADRAAQGCAAAGQQPAVALTAHTNVFVFRHTITMTQYLEPLSPPAIDKPATRLSLQRCPSHAAAVVPPPAAQSTAQPPRQVPAVISAAASALPVHH